MNVVLVSLPLVTSKGAHDKMYQAPRVFSVTRDIDGDSEENWGIDGGFQQITRCFPTSRRRMITCATLPILQRMITCATRWRIFYFWDFCFTNNDDLEEHWDQLVQY